jgi:3-oxoacyl-[acyl-carrier protein] reductase
MNWDKPISEWNVLVTGASSGIGAAIAKRFATMGCNVIINYSSSHEQANEVARTCLEVGGKALTIAADVGHKEQLEKMFEKLKSANMMPDIIVNNAGISQFGLIHEITEEQWDRVFSVNVKSIYFIAQRFLPYMISQKYGRIINISSVWGMSGASCESAYAASKGAVNALTKSLAREVAPSGITVNAVAPGAVETKMISHLNESEYRQLTNEIPAGRLATTDEIAALVYFLSLPESAYINGQIISPNGAWLT